MQTKMISGDTPKRIFYLDVLRCLACIAVVLTHACSTNMPSYGSIDYVVSAILSCLPNGAVPIFVMISGALFLEEKKQITNKKMLYYVLKLLKFYIFWDVVYCFIFRIVRPLITNSPVSFTTILGAIINGHYHLWFIPMLVGLYLIVPLLRLWVKTENKKYVKYYLFLSFIFVFLIPQGMSILGLLSEKTNEIVIFDYINLKYVFGYTSYFILGWYLNNTKIEKKKLFFVLLIVSLSVSVLNKILSAKYNVESFILSGNFSLITLFYVLSLFIVIKNIFIDYEKNNTFKKTICFIGDNSLGIYAIHAGFITFFSILLPKFNLSALSIIIISFLFSFLIPLLLSFIGKKIPFIKKFF